jgi:hypothetical protein
MSKPRAGYSTPEVMALSPILRQSTMHMKEGNLVMEDFDVAEVFFWQPGQL